MTEEIRDQEIQAEQAKPITTKEIVKGVLKLHDPIRARSRDVTELNYDFSAINGWRMMELMDAAGNSPDARINNRQALSLFAEAAGKVNEDLDATDIKARIGAADAMRAGEIAKGFFGLSLLEASRLT